MGFRRFVLFARILCLFLIAGLSPLGAQYREYYIAGKVIDASGQPITGVELSLRDKATSRGYRFTTSQDGAFKFAGLPHGVYGVTIRKEGFATKTDEWNFSTPQDRMQKVEIPPITLVSVTQIEEKEQGERARAGFAEATAKFKQGDTDGALAGLTELLREDPDDPNALYLQGLCYLKKDLRPEATDAFMKLATLVPDFAGAPLQLGALAKRQGEADKALGFFRQASELDPKNPDIPCNIGLIDFEQGRAQEALASFERALELKPDDPEFLEMIGRCHVNLADFPKAIAYLERAKQGVADPDRAKFLGDLIEQLKVLVKKSQDPLPRPVSS